MGLGSHRDVEAVACRTMSRPCHVVRVFTRGTVGGNHLGVVNDVSGLGTEAMQAIASDLGFSETIFVDWQDPDRAPLTRIFTPGMELPFAGHPLVGAAWVLCRFGPGPRAGSLECANGMVRYRGEGDLTWVDVPFGFDSAPHDDTAEITRRAGLPDPARTWRLLMPKEYLIAQYDNADVVAAAVPDMHVLAERFGLLIFARSGRSVRARFFAPRGGVSEDPATGSAAVALASALRSVGERTGELTIQQGEEIGHPSTIELAWDHRRASIGGTVFHDEVRVLEA